MLSIMAFQNMALAQIGLAIGEKTIAGPGTVKVSAGSTVVIFKRKVTDIPDVSLFKTKDSPNR
jgi:hypothetical protein